MSGFLETIRQSVLERFINKKIKKNVPRQPMSMSSSQKIGILFIAENLQDNEMVMKYAEKLKKQGKDVHILGYLHKRNPARNYLFPFISKRDITWFGKPKGGTSGYFIKYPFDILINFAPQEIVPFEYIFALSRAKCRIGFNEKSSFKPYECILLADKTNGIQGMINGLDKYLS